MHSVLDILSKRSEAVHSAHTKWQSAYKERGAEGVKKISEMLEKAAHDVVLEPDIKAELNQVGKVALLRSVAEEIKNQIDGYNGGWDVTITTGISRFYSSEGKRLTSAICDISGKKEDFCSITVSLPKENPS